MRRAHQTTSQPPAPSIPAPTELRFVACPECAALLRPGQTTLLPMPGLGLFVECPACGIGSRVGEWKEARHS
jgi:RNase P subunit RPR2